MAPRTWSAQVFESLVSGYRRELREKKLFVIVQSYIDDSASDVGDRPLFLAGYIGPSLFWQRFSDEWHEALMETPQLKALHMTSSFKGWPRKAREAKLRRLAAIIHKYQPYSIECSINRTDFDRMLKPHTGYDFRHSYWNCFFGIMYMAAKFVTRGKSKFPIDFIFDDQGNVGINALLVFEYMRQFFPPHLAEVIKNPPMFKNDDDVLPLQAADMLVWHKRRKTEPTFTAFDAEILETIATKPLQPIHWNDKVLRQQAEKFAALPGIEWRRNPKSALKRQLLKKKD